MQQPKPARTPQGIKKGPFLLRVGDLLIKEGLIRPSELTQALEIQKIGAEQSQLRIGAP